jgi:ubiquinone/menaquinone biosynthesis C-methylase UbiE
MSDDERREPLPAIVETNVKRWKAEDDSWRGYHKDDAGLVLDARVEEGLRLVRPMPGASYLDIGCANGVLTRVYAERVRAGSVTGVDFVDMGIGDGILFRQANLDTREPLPFDDRQFDVVTCMETLEHLHDTDHVVSEIRRILRPGGYAILAVPRLDALLNMLMLAVGYQPPAIECSLRMRYGSPDSSPRVSGHVSHFTRRALLDLVRANGFVVERFAQASIYGAWRYASDKTPPMWQRLPMWMVSKVPVKQDELLVRIRPVAT